MRHAAESFNYYWPQDLDDDYLVVWDGFTTPVKWAVYKPAELRAFLIERIADGFTFPINPKWILCDAGWYDVFHALTNSPSAQQSVNAWLPPHTGLKEKIEEVHAAYPNGFVRKELEEGEVEEAPQDMALAELALKRHQTLRRAKMKLRFTLKLAQMARDSKKKLAAADGEVAPAPAPSAAAEDISDPNVPVKDEDKESDESIPKKRRNTTFALGS